MNWTRKMPTLTSEQLQDVVVICLLPLDFYFKVSTILDFEVNSW